MKSFLAKIRGFLWSRGFLNLVLVLFGLFVVAYEEEDWRGTHDWLAAKAAWEAKGESFDPKTFIPPPVPDDQNIAALPLFKLENVPGETGPAQLSAVTLRHAMRDDLSQLDFPKLGNYTKGESTDMAAVRVAMAANYALAVKGAQPPNDLLAQFNAIYPFFDDFLSAAASRPFFRIKFDYTVTPSAARPLGPITDPIRLAKILTLHAILAENQDQSDLALQDIKTNLTMAIGVSRDPTLVGGLIGLGVAAIGHPAIYNGLAHRTWSDTELTELDKSLKSVDFLAILQFSMRAQAVDAVGTMEFIQHSNSSELDRVFGADAVEAPMLKVSEFPWPSGWWDNNKRLLASTDLNVAATVDPQAHRCYPKLADRLRLEAHQAENTWDGWAPWKILAVVTAYPMTGAVERFAEGQVWIDQMRIACALERYRLAHNVYPDSLEALAPADREALPCDPMSGKAYRYSRRADGTFLLYSVGWNQTDDGGTIAYSKDNTKQIDDEKGDWVWPTPKAAH